MKIGIVGASGMVGRTFLQLINERNFPVQSLKLFSSSQNKGKTLSFRSKNLVLEPLKPTSFKGLELVFFSAGEVTSYEWAPKAVEAGAVVIDNSAAFRMEENIPLVIPEINISSVPKKQALIIANPNCSTIQLALTLHPLAQKFGLESVCVSSYQSVSGAGQAALQKLKEDSAYLLQENTSAKIKDSVAFNCIPQIGELNEDGFSTEECKIMRETKKILNLPDLNISATAVRTPTWNAHCEAVSLILKKSASKEAILTTLVKQKGLQVVRDNILLSQRFVDGWNDVYVGRLRQINHPKGWMLWIAADNLRKGAALNGLQIAEHLFT